MTGDPGEPGPAAGSRDSEPDGGRPAGGPPTPGADAGMRRPDAPTRSEVVEGVRGELVAGGVDENPRLEAERLVAHVLGLERAELARTGSEELAASEALRLARVVRRRLAGEPLQHIEGTTQFRELILLADRRAFIPRPETEQLVDRVEAWAESRAASRAAGEPPGNGAGGATGAAETGSVTRVGSRRRRSEPLLELALDIGTGSGAIALSLAKEGIARRVVGLDVSSDALLQAAANRGGAELGEERVEFRLVSGSLWTAVERNERFDCIVSNPPYVADRDWEELPEEIRDHEPREALAAGPRGLDVIRRIAEKAASYLRPSGALFLEIGEEQGSAVRDLLEAAASWEEVRVLRDLSGRDRFVRAVRPGAG